MKNKILIILLTLFCSFSIFATDYSFVENPTSLPDKVYTDIALNYNPNSIGTSLFVGFNPFAIGFEGKVPGDGGICKRLSLEEKQGI